ncbi:DUF6677 family protein [Alloacidobacterium dinghuense]|uniref:DUF6677 family protein n=1 Tax=Alloacidobacterium dinghuense TaxID=2763107 RepID=UPI002036E660|nr:DUF6677 family protein [Alloacidobacterium dinghuense]
MMASKVQVSAKLEEKSPGLPYAALILGWLVPGLGHALTKHWIRAILLFVSITSMFTLGILMQGKLYQPNMGDVLEMLGFAGDLGCGALYGLGRLMDLGHGAVQVATADYGTKFIVVAGLLNIISAVDAHNLRIGRKPAC